MISLPADVLPRCFFDGGFSVKNAVHFSAVSRVFHAEINSEAFFKGFLKVCDDRFLDHEFKGNFKENYFSLINLHSSTNEQYPGEVVLGDAVVYDGEVEIISIDESRSFTSYKLKEYSKRHKIVIPEGKLAQLNLGSRDYPIAARMGPYLAINTTCDKSVYVFSSDKFFQRFDFFGEIYCLHIDEDRLYVVEELGGSCNLEVLDLISCKILSSPISFIFPYVKDMPICFGKKYMLYIEQTLDYTRGMAIDYLASNEPIAFPLDVNNRIIRYFPYKDGFLEVYSSEGFIHLAKINIGVVIEREIIAESLVQELEASFYFQDERLFIIYESQVTAYNLLSKKMISVGSVQKGEENAVFESRFLCTAGKAFYVSRKIGDFGNGVEVKSNLTTFSFSKI